MLIGLQSHNYGNVDSLLQNDVLNYFLLFFFHWRSRSLIEGVGVKSGWPGIRIMYIEWSVWVLVCCFSELAI